MLAKGACGRADLLRAMACGDSVLVSAMADLLGYAVPVHPSPGTTDNDLASTAESGATASAGSTVSTAQAHQFATLPFWRIEGCQSLSQDALGEQVAPLEPVVWDCTPKTPAPYRYLAAWRELQPRLREAIAAQRPGGALDWAKVIHWLGQGRLLRRLPRRHRRGWGARIQIIEDRSTRLTPYWQDQAMARSALSDVFPGHALDYLFLHDGQTAPRRPVHAAGPRRYTLPPEGSLVLVLGDLGLLARDGGIAARRWASLGRRLREAGCRTLALLPGAASPRLRGLRAHYEIVTWERRGRRLAASDEALHEQAEALLRLVSPALRIEPGLLRAVRRVAGFPAAVESLVWQHPALISTHSLAATLAPKVAEGLRADFAREPRPMREKVLRCLRDWRAELPQEIWFEEVVSLAPEVRDALPVAAEFDLACRFFEQFSQRGRELLGGEISAAQVNWYARAARRLPDTTWNDPRVGPCLQRLEDHLFGDDPNYRPDHAFDPAQIAAASEPVRSVLLHQQGEWLWFRHQDKGTGAPGSPIGALQSQNGLIRIDRSTDADSDEATFWRAGHRPPWVDRWGFDDFGAWASFTLLLASGGSVTQRLRWIAPGEFLMGSPEDEPGRGSDEGPRHRVALTQGYWLFDTPVTQALWEAVMGSNPSRFKSPTRPVERVTWEACQGFIARLSERVPGLDLDLPSEAQWEYACRAGTEEATYAGPLEILGENNAPALDAIAWYGGNSGVGFELDEGLDSRAWKETQYPHQRAGTHPVGQKRPNAWGLYDMLGNVFEWCADGRRDYQETAERNPLGPLKAGGDRVGRGGSGNDAARGVRCAYRYAVGPGYRYGNLGFRCARVQAGAEPARTRPLQAGHRTAAGSSGVAGRVDLRPSGEGKLKLSTEMQGLTIRSDRTLLALRRRTRPDWASAMGRDRFGLWAEIDLGEGQERQLIQRLRWIAPGEFLMGSPEDEPGRLDREGPQHRVALTQGYWLFDTPVTQALWEAVMESNPSRFKSPTRPVEQVSWEDCQGFIARLNARLPGLGLGLPSEAQWEYACRAGTEEATYAGPLAILGEHNAPALDAIAWYGGNSGVGFELDDGWDTSGWKEQQYPNQRSGTHPVGQKRPNAWGLYDMLGNVYEWCADGRRDYQETAERDPLGPLEAGGRRVIRGGSWGDDARGVRCAYRDADGPGSRSEGLGFRCARVQA